MNKLFFFPAVGLIGFAWGQALSIHNIPLIVATVGAWMCCVAAALIPNKPTKPWLGVNGVTKGDQIPVGPMAAGFVFGRHLTGGADILTFLATDGTAMATLHTTHDDFKALANTIMQEDPKEGHTIQ